MTLPAPPGPDEIAADPGVLELRAAEIARLRGLRRGYTEAVAAVDRELRALGDTAPRMPACWRATRARPFGTFALLLRWSRERPPGSPPMTPLDGCKWLRAHGWETGAVEQQQAVGTALARLCEGPEPAFRWVGRGQYRRIDEPD